MDIENIKDLAFNLKVENVMRLFQLYGSQDYWSIYYKDNINIKEKWYLARDGISVAKEWEKGCFAKGIYSYGNLLLKILKLLDNQNKAENNFYFTYAIETTSWYCLPEPGSTVHSYFQNWNEYTGIAVHAMRQGAASESDSVSAKGAISDKSFFTTDGKAIQFTDTGIVVSSVANASCFTVSKDGMLNMDAEDILLCAQNELNIGI